LTGGVWYSAEARGQFELAVTGTPAVPSGFGGVNVQVVDAGVKVVVGVRPVTET
jgi:hypothetical protein